MMCCPGWCLKNCENTPPIRLASRNCDIMCSKCNQKGHLQWKFSTAIQGKIKNGYLARRRWPFLEKKPFKWYSLTGKENCLYIDDYLSGILWSMLADTGVNVTILRVDLVKDLKGKIIYAAHSISLQENRYRIYRIYYTFRHRVYVAYITDKCIGGVSFIPKFNFAVDIEKKMILERRRRNSSTVLNNEVC